MILKHKEIQIRGAVVSDAEQLYKWWNDGDVMAHAGFPNGLGTTAEKIAKQIEERAGRHIILYRNVPIGEMNYIDCGNGVCDIGIKICEASMQNKGIGKVVLSLFIDGLFHEMGYKKIILDTDSKNERAQHVYEQLGFEKVRVNVDSWKDQLGNLRSAVEYELVEDKFLSYL